MRVDSPNPVFGRMLPIGGPEGELRVMTQQPVAGKPVKLADKVDPAS